MKDTQTIAQVDSSATRKGQQNGGRMTRLDSIIDGAQGRGPHVEPQSQKELILYRIAAGNGKAVSLPAIQQGPGGRFVSDPQARICDLRAAGYLIECQSFKVGSQRHSSYLLVLNPDGSPKNK